MRANEHRGSDGNTILPIRPVPWILPWVAVAFATASCAGTTPPPEVVHDGGDLSMFREADRGEPHGAVNVRMSYADDRPLWAVQRIAGNGQWLALPSDSAGRTFRVPAGEFDLQIQTIHLAKRELAAHVLLPTGARTMRGLMEYPSCEGYACLGTRRFPALQVTETGERTYWNDPIVVAMSDNTEAVVDDMCEARVKLSVMPGDIVWVDYSSMRERCWANCSKLTGDGAGLRRSSCNVVANPPVLVATPFPAEQSSPGAGESHEPSEGGESKDRASPDPSEAPSAPSTPSSVPSNAPSN